MLKIAAFLLLVQICILFFPNHVLLQLRSLKVVLSTEAATVFYRKSYKNFKKFPGKHLSQSFLNKFADQNLQYH